MCYAGCNASCTNSPTAQKTRAKRRNCDGEWCEHHSTTLFENENEKKQSISNVEQHHNKWFHLMRSTLSVTHLERMISHFTGIQSRISSISLADIYNLFSSCPLNHRQHFWPQLAEQKAKDITTTIGKSLKKVMRSAHFINRFVI